MTDTILETRDAAQSAYDEYVAPLYAENRELTEAEEARVTELRGNVDRASARVLQIEEDVKRAELVQELRELETQGSLF